MMKRAKINFLRLYLVGVLFTLYFSIIGSANAEIAILYANNPERSPISMYYEVHGNGYPLFLLHGGFGSSDNWKGQVKEFSKSFKVIVIDSRGHGKTSCGHEPLSYGLMADDLAAFMAILALQTRNDPVPFHPAKTGVHLVGWSDGGITAINFCLKYPELVNKAVFFGVNVRFNGLQINMQRLINMPNLFNWMMDQSKKEDWISLKQETYPNSNVAWADEWEIFEEDMRQMWAASSCIEGRSDPLLALQEITARSLVLIGEADEVVKANHMNIIGSQIPGADVCIMDGAPHESPTMEEYKSVFNQNVLNFLKGDVFECETGAP